jgi:hypothetical protein
MYVRVCVCVGGEGGGFVMCGCFGNMRTCIYCVFVLFVLCFVLFRLCISIVICFFCTSVRTTVNSIAVSNNYYYYYYYYYK